MAQVTSLSKPSVAAPLLGAQLGAPAALPFPSELLSEQEKQNFVGLLCICC